MRWENVRSLFGLEAHYVDEVQMVEPRPLSERESHWVRDILQVNAEWRDADISLTKVIAEGWCGNDGVSYCLGFEAPSPENPIAKSKRESVGQLWVNTDDGAIINVQLSQFQGSLRRLYVLFIDTKHPKRKLPEEVTEVSREAVDI